MKLLGYLFSAVAIGLGFYGLQIMYDNSYSAKIVGGDAYNYIIYATRSTAWLVSGVISAVLGLSCFVIETLAVHSQKSE